MTESTKPEDTPEPDGAPDGQTAAAPPSWRGLAGAAMAAGGVALIAGAFAVAAHLEPRLLGGLGAPAYDPEPQVVALAALSGRVDAMEGRLADAVRSLDGLTLEQASLTTMAGQMDTLVQEMDALADRLDGARHRIETVARGVRDADVSERVGSLADRIGTLETALSDANDTVRTTEARLAASLAALESRIDGLADRTRLLEVVQPGHVAGAAAVALAVGQLRDAALGGRTFSAPLSSVEALLAAEGDIPPDLARVLRELEDHAAAGVATLTDLRRRLSAEASAILHAGVAGAAGWVDETLRRLAAVVTVRRTGDVSGADVDARLARAEARLVAGDLAAAVAELAALTDGAADAAAPWLELANARLAVEAALADLQVEAVSRVAAIGDAAGGSASTR